MTLLDRFVKHAMAWTKILAETADEEGEEAAAQLEPRRLSMAQERA